MAKPKQHDISLRIVQRSGSRMEYQVVLNGITLVGRIIRTYSRGKKVYKTFFNGEMVLGYNPVWLAHKNGRRIKLSPDHPAMKRMLEAA